MAKFRHRGSWSAPSPAVVGICREARASHGPNHCQYSRCLSLRCRFRCQYCKCRWSDRRSRRLDHPTTDIEWGRHRMNMDGQSDCRTPGSPLMLLASSRTRPLTNRLYGFCSIRDPVAASKKCNLSTAIYNATSDPACGKPCGDTLATSAQLPSRA